MTRKKAIEIVVANVKMGWPPKRWRVAEVGPKSMYFFTYKPLLVVPLHGVRGWTLPRKWLEEKGCL